MKIHGICSDSFHVMWLFTLFMKCFGYDDDLDDHDQDYDSYDDYFFMAWFTGETGAFLFFFLSIAKFNGSPIDVHIQYFFETVSKCLDFYFLLTTIHIATYV